MLFEWLKQRFSTGRQKVSQSSVRSDCVTDSALKTEITETVKRELVAQLTPQEYALYLLLMEGYTLNESAKTLSEKHAAAKTRMNMIYKKLGVNSRAELIIQYHTVTKQTAQ